MSETTKTTNYNLVKPNVGADSDLWGDHINFDMDTLDSVIKGIDNRAGVTTWNTRSGAVSLNQADVTTVLPPGAGTPAMDGTATAGTLLTWSRSDHIHPTDTTRYAASNPAGYVTAAQATTAAPVQSVATRTGAVVLSHGDITDWNPTLAPYAPLASPALTGSPTAPTVTPTTDASTKLATTAFVQSALGAVPGGAIVSATPPVANPGALWFDSTGGQTYVRYDDGNTQQWVPVSNITGLANAAQLSDVAPAYNNVGRNVIHNSMFNISQRTGPWSTNGAYTADRWLLGFNGTLTATVSVATDPTRAQIGDESVNSVYDVLWSGQAAAGGYTIFQQYMEDVRRLAGKTVIVSFYAIAYSGSPKVGVAIDQSFGTGGSPSAAAYGNGQAVTLSTTWARYSLTFTVPSVSGKTLGTNGNSYTGVAFWLSAEATYAARSGNIGVQSNHIQVWGVQCEVAAPGQTQPTPLEKPDPELQLRQCQRFYTTAQVVSSGYELAGQGYAVSYPWSVKMRTSATIVITNNANGNMSGFTATDLGGGNGVYLNGNAVASANTAINVQLTASADL